MTQFFQQLINGLSIGSIYALIALGYTMVYGIIKLINFAHGDIYMLGAYVGFLAISQFHLNFFLALLVAMAFCAVLGVVIERIAYKPLRNATRIAALITAIGVSYFLEYSTQKIMGPGVKTYPTTLSNEAFTIFGLHIQLQHAAKLMGINVDATISYTFAIGSALAGAGGVLVGMYYNTINPLMGMVPGIKAFVAAVFGGIGILPGAMFGGFFIGIVESLVTAYGSSLYKDAVVYAILILILIIKPAGLLGKNVKEKV